MKPEARQSVLDNASNVKIVHLRHYAGHFEQMSTGQFKARFPKSADTRPLSKGGTTVAILDFPDGHQAIGVAECSVQDTFSKQIGREMAVGRAIKQELLR